MSSDHEGGRNLILAGFMGTGKTTVGRIVAEELGMHFVDTDTEVEKGSGRSIAEIFAVSGEAAFRHMESAVCLRAARARHQVIAAGGGALLNAASRGMLEASGMIICLLCDLAEIVRRIGHDPSRPLFGGDRERLERLLAGRAAHYRSLPHHLDTTGRTPEQAAEEVIKLWRSAN
jgi:shikimate kinase